MKRALQIALLASVFTSFSALAHHMAEDVVDPEVYEMIESNLVAVDSPHLDLDASTIPSRMLDGTNVRQRASEIRTMPTMRATQR